MATVRQVDTALWLHNKLSSDDPWSGSSLRSLLTPDVLRNIPECFHRLETQVKIKLLTAFLHIPRRVVDETSVELGDILEIGSQDEDEWVRVLCEILRDFPTSGMLNVHLEGASPVFAEVCQEIRNTLAHSDSNTLLPLECPYLNRTALQALVGQQPVPAKHFTLRRKPKSAALRAELAAKANEVMAAQKKAGSASPLKPQSPKKFEAPVRITPRAGGSSHSFLRPSSGRPSTSGSSGSRSIISAATLKQHGRTKLLDINEQPIGGGRELKRRKKMQDADQPDEVKQRKVDASKAQEPATPKYAAGLTPVSSHAKSSSPDTPSTGVAVAPATPSYAVLSGEPPVTTPPGSNPGAQPPATSESSLSESTINLKRELEMHMEQQRQLMFRERQQKRAAAAAMANLSTAANPTAVSLQSSTPTSSRTDQSAAGTSTASTSVGSTAPQSSLTAHQQQTQQQDTKRQLSLSREQMLAAHEMFRNANRVTRTEKALILGFMAGARDKPFNHQGPIITIKLSENTESSHAADGSQQTLLVEMLFEMNYDTGHWRRLKRTRVLSKQAAASQD